MFGYYALEFILSFRINDLQNIHKNKLDTGNITSALKLEKVECRLNHAFKRIFECDAFILICRAAVMQVMQRSLLNFEKVEIAHRRKSRR